MSTHDRAAGPQVPGSHSGDEAEPGGRPQHAVGRREAVAVTALPIVIAAALTLMLLAFGLPAVKGRPHDLPLGLAGPPAQTAPVVRAIQERQPGAFDLTTYASGAELTQAIRDREVYGGVVLSPTGPQVLTASAASAVVAQSLAVLGTELAGEQGAQPRVTDVVPLPPDDPRGAGIVASLLPIIAGTIVPAVALARITRRRTTQLMGLVVAAVVAGLSYAAVLHFILGTLTGSYLAESAVFAAALAAGGVALLGLNRLAGLPALGVGAALLLLLGNPLSGAATAPEFFPPVWRAIGQGMTPGATIQLLRSVSFFEGAAMAVPLLVLSLWAAGGLLLLALPRRSVPSAADSG